MKFEYYSDSSYIFTTIEKSSNHGKVENFSGYCYFKKDTLYFKPVKFDYTKSEKAVIKNNFIEFIDANYPLRIEIKKNAFKTKNKLDFKKYSDYAFFTFDPKIHERFFNYKPNNTKPYDLNQKELVQVNQILKRCFSENRSKLNKINEYVKQCTSVINDKGEKEIWLSCYCKSPYKSIEYKYSLFMMDDGGNCNINLKINLTKHNYTDLNIAGQA